MGNTAFKFIVLIAAVACFNLPCVAGESEASTFAHNEAPRGLTQSTGGGLSSQVNYAIQNSADLSDDAKHVNVADKDGAIVITGTVHSDSERAKINSILENSGATSVRNEIKVQKADQNNTAHKAKTITR